MTDVSGIDDMIQAIKDRPTLFVVALLIAIVGYGVGQFGLDYLAPDPATAFSLGWALGVIVGAAIILLAVRQTVPLRAIAGRDLPEETERE